MAIAKRVCGLAVFVLMAFVGACGDDGPTDIEGDPDMAAITGVVHDSAAVLPPGRTEMPPADTTDYDGVATGSAEIEVYSELEGWTSLGAAADVTFDIYCEEAAVIHTAAAVAAATYSRVRLTLTDVETSVVGGAVIEGVVHADPFVVALGDGAPVVIEKDVTPFTLAGEEGRTVLFDLNTELWLDDAVIAAATVSATEIQAATNVFIR